MTATSELRFSNARGESLAATLVLPDGYGPWPGVVLCQGMSGVRNLVLPHVAERLAAVSIATLRFDYAGFGESEGERGWIDPGDRVQDARAALTTLSGQTLVDGARLGVYGHSLGGPVALAAAAASPTVKAAAVVSSPGPGREMLRAARPAWDWVTLRHRVDSEREHIAAGGSPTVVGIEEIFPFSPKFAAAYAALKGSQGGTSALAEGSGLGTSTFYLASVERIVDSHPEESAAHLGHCATLLVNGESDDTAPVETLEPVVDALAGPHEWVIIPGADHNDLDSGTGLDRALDAVCSWFGRYL